MSADARTDRAGIAQLRSNWFGSVAEISDIDLQRRTWLDSSNRNPHWSYVEFTESYPYQEQLAQAQREHWLTAAEFAILSELGRILEGYTAPGGDNYDPAAVLRDPQWRAVVEAAERARRQLLTIMTDPGEREVLLGEK